MIILILNAVCTDLTLSSNMKINSINLKTFMVIAAGWYSIFVTQSVACRSIDKVCNALVIISKVALRKGKLLCSL